MNISDNILREHLKNVYFLSGGAYGGKTTMAKLIEEKYGYIRYRQGDHSADFEKIACSKYQPAMSHDRSRDWHAFFAQSPKDYWNWLETSQREEEEFAILDLLRLPKDQKIIADVGFSPQTLHKISHPSRVVLLFAPEEMTRQHYFDRADKDEVYRFIVSFPDGADLLCNVIDALHYGFADKKKAFYDSGFYCIERAEDDTIERTLRRIEAHFGLTHM